MSDDNLPLGLLLLGVAGIAGFMAFRPWPMPGGNPIKPGAYAVEILQGHPPGASTPPDRKADIAVIEGGLVTLLGVWAASKLAGALSGLGGGLGGGGGEAGGGGGAGEGGGGEGGGGNLGEEIAGDVEKVASEAEVAP